MKILMLAPEPFFQPRGTPISVYFRLQALSTLGHEVDLITYHIGENKSFNNVRILRIPNLFRIKKIKIGPSWAKIPLDILMLIKTIFQLTIKRYDLIFSHEEAAFFGTALARLRRIPHVYDMHSSLPQQLENFNFSRSPILKKIFGRLERFVLKNSQAVIVICPDLLNTVKQEGYERKAVLLENFLDFEQPACSLEDLQTLRRQFASLEQKIVLYAGNFQPYQGIPLLLEAAARITDERAIFLLVGDTPEAVARMRQKARDLNISEKVHFTGQVDPALMPQYLKIADVLVSPRLSGTNTPLKIYSFLKSGKPMVATDLWTHTQVLDTNTSILVKPEAEKMADGISRALFDRSAQTIAENAQALCARNYSTQRYLDKISLILAQAVANKKKTGKQKS